jgi:hypothetical protein
MSNLKSILWNISMLAVLAILICPLHGCTTTKYVPVKETHTDTVYKARKDSVKWIEKIHYVDKEKSKDSTATTLDAKGNITRTDTWHWRDRTSSNSDSLLYYKFKLDSALQSKTDSVPQPYPIYKNKYIEKKLSGWQNFIIKIGYVGLLAIILALVYGGVKAWKKFNVAGILSKIIKHIRL